MNLQGIFYAPDSGAGDGASDGAGDGAGEAGTVGAFDPTTLVWPLKATLIYGAGWKVGDTLPALVADLADGAGVKPDLTGATVVFRMRPVYGSTATVTGAAVVDPDQATNTGRVSYAWQPGDIATDGQMLAEFCVTFPAGGVATFPDNDYLTFTVLAAIA